MKKFFTLFIAAAMTLSMLAADVVFTSADFNGQGTSGTGSEVTATKGGVTFTCDKAFGDQYGVRCYKNSVVTISSEEQQIGKIIFEFATVSGKYYNGDLDEEIAVDSTVWTNTMTNQARMNKISIYFGNSSEVGEQYDTLSVAMAIEKTQALADGAQSEEKYFVEGFAVNVSEYSTQYKNQIFFMVDDAAAPDSVFQAYGATPEKEGKAYPVLAGDKVRAFGYLKKFVKNNNVQLEIVNPTVEFLEEVEGDRTIEEPVVDTVVVTVAQAVEIGKALADKAVTETLYEITGYVSSIASAYSEQYGNENFWIMDEKGSTAASTAEGAFYVYRGKPNTGAEVGLNGKIKIVCKIKNYDGIVENDGSNIVFEVLEQGEGVNPPVVEQLDTITVAQALEIGNALEENGQTSVKYVIEGYVSSIESPFDSQYKNETFWITDEKGSHAATNDEGAFYVYRGTPTPSEEIGWNARVFVTSVIKKYMKSGKAIIETNGKVDVNVVESGEEEKFDTISVAEALEIGYALEYNAKTAPYVISGYVSSIESYFDSKYGNETFWLSDDSASTAASNDDGAFYVYRAKPDSAKELGWNAKVFVKSSIYSYAKIACDTVLCSLTIETGTSNAPVSVVEYGVEEEIDTITVAQALEIGMALAPRAATPNRYVITGYVSAIDDPYSETYGNETFWITDEKGSRAASSSDGAFEVYRGKPDAAAEIGLDAKIRILCKIKNYSPTIENDGMGIVFEVLETGTPLQIDTITVERALEIGMALEDNAYTQDLYVVKGYAVKAYPRECCKSSQNIYMADYMEDFGEFYGYNASGDKEIETNDYLLLRGKIQKYVKGDKVTIELSYGSATHANAPKIDTIKIDVKEAYEIGMKLNPTTKTSEYYLVTGYVAKITGEFDEDEKNESFWMNDEEDAVEGPFFANLARIDEPGAGEHQRVGVFGRIQRYVDEEGETIIRIDKGSAKLLNDEGIENVVLTEQATKVLVDGVLYIIRDNKMYNIQGARVR